MNQTEQIIQVLSRSLGTFGVLLSLTQNTTALHIIKEQIRDLNKAIDHVNETPKIEHDSDDVLNASKLVRLTTEEVDDLIAISLGLYQGMEWDEGLKNFAHLIMNAVEKKNSGPA